MQAAPQNTIEPIFKEKDAELYLGDMLETLDSFPADSADLIFADPPYNLSNGGFTCHSGKRASVNKGEWDKSLGIDNDFGFHMAWIGACRRILKDNGTLWVSGTYHSIFACGYALQKTGWHLLNDIVWYKPNAAPNLACRMFTASHETLLWARKSKSARHYFDYEAMKLGAWENDFLKKPGKQMRSVWSIPPPAAHEKKFGKHPAQKPVELMKRVILASCPPGGTVLDPFCGSGATGVAALRLGRKFIGIDSERNYLEKLAKPRILEILAENSLWKEAKP